MRTPKIGREKERRGRHNGQTSGYKRRLRSPQNLWLFACASSISLLLQFLNGLFQYLYPSFNQENVKPPGPRVKYNDG